jgi:hypothetical protein
MTRSHPALLSSSFLANDANEAKSFLNSSTYKRIEKRAMCIDLTKTQAQRKRRGKCVKEHAKRRKAKGGGSAAPGEAS